MPDGASPSGNTRPERPYDEREQSVKQGGAAPLDTQLFVADQTRGLGEAAAMRDLGAAPPRQPEQRAVFGDGAPHGGFGPGKWKLLCKPGTAVLLDYNMFHRGTRRMPGALWRCMFKLQFFRVSMPAAPGWDTASRGPDPAPFAGLGRDAGDEAMWTAVWHWLRGERPVERPGPGHPGAFKRPQRFPM